MLGILQWKARGRRCPVTVGERRVLHVRFLCAEVEPGRGLLLGRRVRSALRRLKKLGVTEVVLPGDFPFPELVTAAGLAPASSLELRRGLAADWLRAELEARGLPGVSLQVAVAADRLTGELVRTVTELSLRYRYVLLDAERGGEELARQLRREYGVSLQTAVTAEQADRAEAALLFAPRERWSGKNPVCLRLYDGKTPLPPLLLPPVLEEQLPVGVDREALLGALYRAGALRPGQVTVGRVQTGS